MPCHHDRAISYFLNVLVFSINVACNSENLFVTWAKVGEKIDLCQKLVVFIQKTYVNVYGKRPCTGRLYGLWQSRSAATAG